jgi:hypothetical protein
VTTNPDKPLAQRPAEAEAQPPPAPHAATPLAAPGQPEPLPAGYEDFAGEIKVVNGPMPRWFRRLPYVALLACLAYYLHVRAFDPVNLVFAALFIIWMIYTPIAQKRGWFFIPM